MPTDGRLSRMNRTKIRSPSSRRLLAALMDENRYTQFSGLSGKGIAGARALAYAAQVVLNGYSYSSVFRLLLTLPGSF